MKKVAIIKFNEFHDSWNGGIKHISESVTDWKEVTEEEFKDLKYFVLNHYKWDAEFNYVLLEQENLEDPFTLSNFLEKGKNLRRKHEAEAKAREEKARKAKETREANKKKKELEQLAKLKNKYEKE